MSAKWKEIDEFTSEESNLFSEELSKSAQRCKSQALRYVAMQIKTEGQVSDYLKRKGYSGDDIEIALDFLREYKYVDDKRYCESFFREAALKGKGRRRIEQELEQKKISRHVVREALDELLDETNPDYDDLIAEILTEKERALAVGRKLLRAQLDFGHEADKSFMAKVGRRLVTYGYGSDVVYSVIGVLMKEYESQKEDDCDLEK